MCDELEGVMANSDWNAKELLLMPTIFDAFERKIDYTLSQRREIEDSTWTVPKVNASIS